MIVNQALKATCVRLQKQIAKRITMKNFILITGVIVGILAVHSVFAQNEGTIGYNVKVNVHRNIPPDRPEMKEMVPEFNEFRAKLSFNGNESFFTMKDEEEEEDSFADEDGPVQIRMRHPQNEYYFDHASGKKILVKEFFGKLFLIEDSVKILPWKLHPETKDVLGHVCRKATWIDKERNQNVTAWYADKLKPFIGPEEFNSLPGTVLLVDINEGERVIMAESISFDKPAKGSVAKPVKGQRVTEQEFRRMMDDHRKRNGGRANIIINNN
jgi:GLPGLI family protein